MRIQATLLLCMIIALSQSKFLENNLSEYQLIQYSNEGSSNPFDESTHQYAVNPHYVKEIQASKTLSQSQKNQLENIAAAYWVDSFSAISEKENSLKNYLDSALAKQKSSGKKQTVVFMVYDLPNRDCAAAASNGEICCDGQAPNPYTGACSDASYNSGDCSKGLAKYHNYVDTLFNLIQNYQELELVALVEPDSLPNMATNLNQKPHCTYTTQTSYIQGIQYSLKKLASLKISMYLDIAHGGWLGWCGTHTCYDDNSCNGQKCVLGTCQCDPYQDQNAQRFVKDIKSIFDNVGPSVVSKIRGFATNTANYQPLGYPVDQDYCQLQSQYNFATTELRYIEQMDALFKQSGISKTFITDTGRNGRQTRNDPYSCQQWCNIQGGIGIRPTSNTQAISSQISATLDAVYWLKTPGESDGCSPGNGQTCTRVDSMCQRDCSSSYQSCPAPEAGQWNDQMIKVLADNANPPLNSYAQY